MVNGEYITEFSEREGVRADQFNQIWTQELDNVFADVARYYDRANHVASLGLWSWLHERFMSTITLQAGQKILDVCAGTNAIGIACLKKQPDLKVHAIDRSEAMQEVGRRSAAAQGLHIEGVIGDVHRLPYPDNHFDTVILRYASRHLRIMEVFEEIKRVLKPGGHFYHCDMLRPGNKVIERLYYCYLQFCLTVTAWVFRSGPPALAFKKYFINAIRSFYSAGELSRLLVHVGYQDVSAETVLGGMVGFHKAVKAESSGKEQNH